MLGNLGGCYGGGLEQDLLDFRMDRELLERLETFQKGVVYLSLEGCCVAVVSLVKPSRCWETLEVAVVLS
ncbi:MAG: hypothetical protein GDA51_09995 [Ekhidna sp.]|nr:hypothetical protein [Ekhidna sp.]